MTDSYSQSVSSAWIGKRVCVKKEEKELSGTLQYFGEIITADGKWCGIELDESLGGNDGMIDNERYFVCKDKHGIFVPMSETKQLPLEIFSKNLSCDFVNFGFHKPLNLNEEQDFSLNLSVENNSKRKITNSSFDSPVNFGLNKTFDISVKKDCSRKTFHANQMSRVVLDNTIQPSSSKIKSLLEKHSSVQWDSEDSLGIIPDAVDDFNATWDLLNSCSIYLNQYNKENCVTGSHDIAISEVLSPQNLDCCDLKKICFEDNNSPVQSCVTEARYTSTPKQPMKCITLDSSVIIPQNQHTFFLHDEVKDEPILAGSSQPVSKIYFDDVEFDRSKILSSTSKVSSLLQIHHDLLNRTSNLNTKQTFSEKFKLEACKALHHTNILNATFEIKPVSLPAVLNCITMNKTFSENNLTYVIEDGTIRNSNHKVIPNDLTSVIEDDTIRNSNQEIIPNDWNRTQILNSSESLNASVLKIINESKKGQNIQFNQCRNSVDETVCMHRASLGSKNIYPKNICLSINSSVNSLKTTSENTNLTFELNSTFIKNDEESQAEQSTYEHHFNKRCSLLAIPVMSKANSFKFDLVETPFPVSSKLDSLPKSKPSLSVSKAGVEAKIPKKFIKGALSKSVEANTSEKNKGFENAYDRSNDLALEGTEVQSKTLEVKEAKLKSKVALQTKAGLEASFDDLFIPNGDLSKHLTSSQHENAKTYGSAFLNSHVKTSDNSKDKNRTFSASDEFHESTAVNEWGKCEIPDEVSDKSRNDPAVHIEQSPTDKVATKVVNSTETKIENFVKTFVDKNTLNIHHSYGRDLEDVSKKSTLEYENINPNVSLKCGVKGIFPKTINRPRLSFVPTLKSNVPVSLSSENKNACTGMHIGTEFQDSSRISSKQHSGENIQVPKFHSKSSSGNSKELTRSQGKTLQKRNVELNSVPLGKNIKQDSNQSDSQRFSQNGRVLKPITEKISKVLTVAIPKKENLDTVELKSDQISRIPSFASCQRKLQLQKIHAPRSHHR